MIRQIVGPVAVLRSGLPGAAPAGSGAALATARWCGGSAVMRRWVCGVTALVLTCASGCASPSTVSTPPPPPTATTSTPASAPDGSSYAGVHWIATQVSVNSVNHSIPTAMAVTVDFLQSGSVVFSDGVNVIDARWASLTGETVRLDEVRSSAAGYVGHDSSQLAAILAVQHIDSPSVAGDSVNLSWPRGDGLSWPRQRLLADRLEARQGKLMRAGPSPLRHRVSMRSARYGYVKRIEPGSDRGRK